jgi:hypothetical protein
MLTPTERAALRAQWFAEIEAEIERRRAAAFEAEGGDATEKLLAQLDAMAERLRAAPDYVEPSDAQKTQWGEELDAWFRDHGYG